MVLFLEEAPYDSIIMISIKESTDYLDSNEDYKNFFRVIGPGETSDCPLTFGIFLFFENIEIYISIFNHTFSHV